MGHILGLYGMYKETTGSDERRKTCNKSLSVMKHFVTFSQPSIFSLFLSLLLGLESTLIREPRESAWLPAATAKEEKAGGVGE